MVLDLDPGQPEYSPPGVISLCKISSPNLSPSFCHPTLAPTEGQVRAHAIANVTPGLDPEHFVECALDLFHRYQQSPDAGCPLVINTPGWIQGTGLDILTELINSIKPTEVIYMSQDGPEETVDTLQSACNSPPAVPFSALPSQPPTDMPSSRTSLHLRTMQTMSYFHLLQTQPLPSWDPNPLTELRPWRVRYAGRNRGILGILCYDHQPAPELLAEAINGTILALVKLESRTALRDLLPPEYCHGRSQDDQTETTTTTTTTEQSQNADATVTFHEKRETDDPKQKIPLIPNPRGRTLDPRHSHLLSLVLVRGIDTARGELQLLTPPALTAGDAAADFAGLRGEEVVLVAGRFDTPTWAYTEDLYRRQAGGGGGRGSQGEDDEGDGEEMDESEEGEDEEDSHGEDQGSDMEVEVPWVEMLHGNQKRAAGSKVWRVRRDLGRN